MARMLRPPTKIKTGRSARLYYGIRWRTLLFEERCRRMITNPAKSTCASTTPQLSECSGVDACLIVLHSKLNAGSRSDVASEDNM